MTATPLTTETATAPTLDTTEIPVQVQPAVPVSARAMSELFPYTAPAMPRTGAADAAYTLAAFALGMFAAVTIGIITFSAMGVLS